MKKPIALMMSILFPCLVYGAVGTLDGEITWRTDSQKGKGRRAAVAIRDNVTPFQKWGSRHFTLPYLNMYYEEAWYFTQSDSQDCRQAFLSRLDSVLTSYDEVDLYILAHNNRFIDWVASLPEEHRSHLRLVYNTGCRDLRQGPLWLGLGADAYLGHPGISMSPLFYFYFLRHWTGGKTLRDAVDMSNASVRSTLATMNPLLSGNVDVAEIVRESEGIIYGNDQLQGEE